MEVLEELHKEIREMKEQQQNLPNPAKEEPPVKVEPILEPVPEVRKGFFSRLFKK